MKLPLLAGTLGILVLTTNHASAVEPAKHTVAWYRTHQQARDAILRECQNDHTYDEKADCRNALSASHAAVADSFTQGGSAETDPEANPAYYGHNGPLIAMILSMCSSNVAPQSWCTAARTAAGNQAR